MHDMSVDDLCVLYRNSIVLVNNKPVYVELVNNQYQCLVLDLLSQRHMTVSYTRGLFKAPTRRIGFVNVNGSVVYVYRNPVRKYKVGYSEENVKVCTLDVNYPLNRSLTRDKVERLKCIEIADAMANRYPCLSIAFENAREFNGACAFDKQFAVTYDGIIFYKTAFVGNLRKVDDAFTIVFDKDQEHLKHLLGELS